MNKAVLTSILSFAIILIGVLLLSFTKQQGKEPWTENQLMPPADLVNIINEGNKLVTFIYSVGPSGLIKNAIDIGEGRDKKNLSKLKNVVSTLPKNANIVLYCGCCPFKDCPNIRPTFHLLTKMKFTNHKLLNLPNNLKVDWIDKGYPMND